MANRLAKIAGQLGAAVGTFQKNRMQAVRGKRAPFLASMAQQGKWRGSGSGSTRQAQRRAVQNSWVFVACSFISRQVSAAEFQVFKHQKGKKDPVRVPGHPLEVVLRRPNPWMGSSYMWQYSAWWQQLNGNSYWYLGLDRGGELAEIWPMPSEDVEPFPGDEERFVDFYRYTVGGHAYDIPAEYVVHTKLVNPFDVFRGMSPLKAAILPSDVDLFMSRWNAAFFGRDNTMPSAIINISSEDPEHPLEDSDIAALKEDLRQDYHSIKRKAAIVSAAKLEVELLGWNPKDLDFIQGRQFTREEIYEIYGIPPGLLDKNATYANSANARMVFNNYTLWPLLVLTAEQLTAELVWPLYGESFSAGFIDVRETNRETELQELGSAGPYLTIDEIRAKFWKLPPLPDGRGEITADESQRGDLGGGGDNLFGREPPAGRPPEGPPSESPPPSDKDRSLPLREPPAGQPLLEPGPADEPPKGSASNELRERIGRQDLRNWRTKAIRSVSNGEPLPVGFRSKFLPGEAKTAVSSGLRALQAVRGAAADDVVLNSVKALFQEVKVKHYPFDRGGATAPMKAGSSRPWDRLERTVRKQVKEALERQVGRILDRITKDGEAVVNDEAFWTEHRQSILDSLMNSLSRITELGVDKARSKVRRDVRDSIDWDLVNKRAEDWARQHAADLVTQVTETTREEMRRAVGDWINYGEALPDLQRRIEGILKEAEGDAREVADRIKRMVEELKDRLPDETEEAILQAIQRAGGDVARLRRELGKVVGKLDVPSLVEVLKPRVADPAKIKERARLIAQTESTGAYASGNAEAWQEAGAKPAVFKPPAHPGCRCYLQPKKLGDIWVMVWYTARDELVCEAPIDTPWGKVNGCKALHRVVVSEGPKLGRRV